MKKKAAEAPLRILLAGAGGKMGREVSLVCAGRTDVTVTGGIDRVTVDGSGFPVFLSAADVTAEADVLVDFSSRELLPSLLSYADGKGLPLVCATTGLREAEEAMIADAARRIPVFRSRNLSLGVSLLCRLASDAAKALGEDADIEIVEAHHGEKTDAPSGTALMLAQAVRDAARPRAVFKYDRHLSDAPRSPDEIGIHTVRGGGIVGEHLILFAGKREVLRLSHSALSRAAFAEGAIAAARFVCGCAPGLYGMEDLLQSRMDSDSGREP